MRGNPTIKAFFDEATNTVSYLVSDPDTKRAAIVDPVLDYNHASGKASTKSADDMLAAAEAQLRTNSKDINFNELKIIFNPLYRTAIPRSRAEHWRW